MKFMCVSGLHVLLRGTSLDSFTVQASVPGLAPLKFECPNGVPTLFESGGKQYVVQCSSEEIFFVTFTPEVIDITIQWSGGSVTQTVHPAYHIETPNGPDCEPKCRIGVAQVNIP